MIKEKKKLVLADIGLVVVSICWGGGFVAGKFALDYMDPFAIMAYRYGLAAVLMVPITYKHFRYINRDLIKKGLLIGGIMFVDLMLQTIGLQYTTPGKQTFIITMYIVIVPLISWLVLKKRPENSMIVASLLAFFGIGLITLNSNLAVGIGDGLTFLFAIGYSVQIILIDRFLDKEDVAAFAFVCIVVCAILAIIGCIFVGDYSSIGKLEGAGIWGLLYLIIINTVIGYGLQNLCQTVAPPNHVALIMSLEVVFGTIFAIWLANEVFTFRMGIGGVIMFIAIIISKLPTFVELRQKV